jgi:hypothetical protein
VPETGAGLDLLGDADGHSVLQRWDGKHLETLAKAAGTNVGLYQEGSGHDVLVGTLTGLSAASVPGLSMVSAKSQPQAVSFRGDALALNVLPGVGGRPGGPRRPQGLPTGRLRRHRTGRVHTRRLMFCSPSLNSGCNPNETSGTPASHCPATDTTCWWNQPISWISGTESANAAVENLTYALGSPEPAIKSEYGKPDCAYPNFAEGSEYAQTFVIGTLPDSGQNIFGCPTKVLDGKFSIRLGDNFAGLEEGENGLTLENPLTAQIDLHQLGAGWMGHIFFTHSYADGTLPSPPNPPSVPMYSNKVTGAWTPDPAIFPAAGQTYDIRVHLPSHGGNVSDAHYYVQPGTGTAGDEPAVGCTVNQSTNGTDEWLDLGITTLYPGARVLLSNLTPDGSGTADVAFDAVAFTPTGTGSWCPNGTSG